MMKRIVMLLLLTPSLLFAHSGHGPVDTGPAHYLLSIEHYLGLIAVIGGAYFLYARRKAKRHA